MNRKPKEMKEDTLPKLLRKNYQLYDNGKIAMRNKAFGIWQRCTWKDYYEKVRYLCLGLTSMGLERNDKVAIVGENGPEFYWFELAIQVAGGVMVGIFPDCSPQEVKYYVTDSDAKFVIASDQEQVDKVLSIREELPLLQKIIYWKDKGLWNYKQDILFNLDLVLDLGQAYETDHPHLFDEMIDRGNKQDVGVICYTSGTTGDPKGVMLSHEWMINSTLALAELDDWKDNNYEYLSFNSPALAIEQLLGISGNLVAGVRLNFPEKPDTVQENIREVGPQLLFCGARMLENINRTVQTRMIESTWLRRKLFNAALKVGLRVTDMEHEKLTPPPWLKFLHFLAFHGVIRALRDRLGLTRVKTVYSTGSIISPYIIRYFKALSVNISLFYSTVELGVVSVPQKNGPNPESSGIAAPWAKIKISDHGEILVKSKYTPSGYCKNEAATKANITEDGWVRTGDSGFINRDAHLIVIDRMKNLKQLGDNRQFFPLSVEAKMKISPYINNIIAISRGEQGVVGALIDIDRENVSKFVHNTRIAYATFSDLSQDPEVIGLIKREIEKLNDALPEWSRVKRFINLYEELDSDEYGRLLTRTGKIRRAYVEERYNMFIDVLFSNEKSESAVVDVPITDRDGRTDTVEIEIFVNNISG